MQKSGQWSANQKKIAFAHSFGLYMLIVTKNKGKQLNNSNSNMDLIGTSNKKDSKDQNSNDANQNKTSKTIRNETGAQGGPPGNPAEGPGDDLTPDPLHKINKNP